ncbi:hypothetical protein GGI24_001972 [Coemansia furcata]|nr:hypothetical protein GGI24_001972 [Coemansia furcata]
MPSPTATATPPPTVAPAADVVQALPSVVAAAAASAATQRGNPYAGAAYAGQSAYLAHKEQQKAFDNARKAAALAADARQSRDHFPRLPASLPLAPAARPDAAHRDLGEETLTSSSSSNGPSLTNKRMAPGPSGQNMRANIQRTEARPSPSARRGPNAAQIARLQEEIPALTIPVAYLHFPGAGLQSANLIKAHCADILERHSLRTTIGNVAPIHAFCAARINAIGVSFISETILQMMIAFPPTINGTIVPWRGERGVMHPIVACGVPLDKARYALNAALKDVSNGCSHLQQEYIDDNLVGDWSALLYLEEGQQLPTEIRFHKSRHPTPIFPAHIAVPCVTCRRRNPDHCLCPAPLCHHVHKERRTAEQAAASLEIAEEAARQEAAALVAAQQPADSETASNGTNVLSESETPHISAILADMAPISSSPTQSEALIDSAILTGSAPISSSPTQSETLIDSAILVGSAPISPSSTQSEALSDSATLAGPAPSSPLSPQSAAAQIPTAVGASPVPTDDHSATVNVIIPPVQSDVEMDDDVDMGEDSEHEEHTYIDDTGSRRVTVTSKPGKSKTKVNDTATPKVNTNKGGIKKTGGKSNTAATAAKVIAAAEGIGRNTRSSSRSALEQQTADDAGGEPAHTPTHSAEAGTADGVGRQ